MLTLRFSLRLFALVLFALTIATVASAQTAQRTFVSTAGSDANTASLCSAANPCRSFTAAQGVTTAGGEIIALTSGGYGPVEIIKALQITAPTGVYVAITSQTAGQSAITVSAANTDTVVIRGLTLTGLGGENGILVTSVGTLHIEGCVISGFTGPGINVNLSADGSHIFIKDTITRNNRGEVPFNNGTLLAGNVLIMTSVGVVQASIDNCRFERSVNNGILAFRNSRVTINRSVASGNGEVGFRVDTTTGNSAELNCEECVASNNLFGFSGGTDTSPIRVSDSAATNNTNFGFAGNGPKFESLGNNLVRGNGFGDTTGTITVIPAQ